MVPLGRATDYLVLHGIFIDHTILVLCKNSKHLICLPSIIPHNLSVFIDVFRLDLYTINVHSVIIFIDNHWVGKLIVYSDSYSPAYTYFR